MKRNRNKKKGNEGEREVAAIFNEAFQVWDLDLVARRILTESREGSFDVEIVRGQTIRKMGEDLRGSSGQDLRRDGGDPEDALPYTIQVKNVTSQYGGYLYKAWLEARAYDHDRIPVGVVKVPSRKGWVKRDQWLAVVPLEHYAELLTRLEGDPE